MGRPPFFYARGATPIACDRAGSYNSGAFADVWLNTAYKGPAMKTLVVTALMLVGSNVFMTFAWYAHLKNLSTKPWLIAVLVSWSIAFFEYLIQVPANRLGHAAFSVAQLKILQEVITLLVFVPFSVLYLREGLRTDYIWAGLCMLAAVYFIFRGA